MTSNHHAPYDLGYTRATMAGTTGRKPARVSQSLKTEQPTSTLPRDLASTPENGRFRLSLILRKEVIQPHLPIRLPCYDFTPIICPTFGGWLHKGYLTDFGCYKLSWCDGRCVQGPGTYSPRHADPRLLAIPTSCRRVAACNPN